MKPLLSIALGIALLSQGSTGIFDGQTDVGHVQHAGSASYDRQRQEYSISGSGQNMWGERDDFHFVWKRLTGNFTLRARARFIGAGVEAHRKIGWTIRPSLATDGIHVTAARHGDGLISLQYRRTIGGITEELKSADSLPDGEALIQLERRGGVYIMSVGKPGGPLTTTELTGVALPDTVYAGLFVCAHNDSVVERGVFSAVTLQQSVHDDLMRKRR
jgi:TolB protein